MFSLQRDVSKQFNMFGLYVIKDFLNSLPMQNLKSNEASVYLDTMFNPTHQAILMEICTYTDVLSKKHPCLDMIGIPNFKKLI